MLSFQRVYVSLARSAIFQCNWVASQFTNFTHTHIYEMWRLNPSTLKFIWIWNPSTQLQFWSIGYVIWLCMLQFARPTGRFLMNSVFFHTAKHFTSSNSKYYMINLCFTSFNCIERFETGWTKEMNGENSYRHRYIHVYVWIVNDIHFIYEMSAIRVFFLKLFFDDQKIQHTQTNGK